MRRVACLTLPLLFLFFTGCADQTTAPDIDVTASFAKGGGGKPPKPGGGDPPAPAKPVISFLGGSLRHPALQVMDADGGNKTAIYNGADFMHSSWSPLGDGTALDPYVILVSAGGPRAQPLEKLEVVIEGGVPVVQSITTFSSETRRYWHATVRPNGEDFLVVDLGDPALDFYDLFLGDMDMVEGATMQLLYRSPEGRWLDHPTWSADGMKVAFFERGITEYGSADVRILNMSVEPFEVTTAFSVTWVDAAGGPFPHNLSWARTSNELLLDVEGLIYRVDLDDVPTPALGDPIAEGTYAVWSPDDTQMAYLDKFLYVKTFGVSQDQRFPGGWYPDWRRNPIQ
ncbi:MAG: hypothetical protein ABIF09_13670 [Gemmatimonadota bacterium]